MASLKKVNEAITNLQAAQKIFDDAVETFIDSLDVYKDELKTEKESEVEEEND